MVCTRGKTKGVGRMTGDAVALPVMRGDKVMKADHTAVQVRSSG